MENPDIQQEVRESQFFEGLQSGNPGIYILNRALREDEKRLVPSPSSTYFFEGVTFVEIYGSVAEALLDPKTEARRQLHDGIKAIIGHMRSGRTIG